MSTQFKRNSIAFFARHRDYIDAVVNAPVLNILYGTCYVFVQTLNNISTERGVMYRIATPAILCIVI